MKLIQIKYKKSIDIIWLWCYYVAVKAEDSTSHPRAFSDGGNIRYRNITSFVLGGAFCKSHFFLEVLLKAITTGLVDNPDAISIVVDEPHEEGVTVFHLHVDESDMGRVIGKQGRIAKAIRVVMRAAANRRDAKISVEID